MWIFLCVLLWFYYHEEFVFGGMAFEFHFLFWPFRPDSIAYLSNVLSGFLPCHGAD